MAGFTPSGGEQNIPAWREDTNSPFAGDGTGPLTCSLSSAYDHILVDINIVSGSNKKRLQMQVNGQKTNYRFLDETGSATLDAPSIPIMAGDGEDGFVGTVKVSFFDGSGFGSGRAGIGGRPQTGAPEIYLQDTRAVVFGSNDINNPLSQVTITDANSAGIRGNVHVYGRNR
jgi:hypothetical protein